MKTVTVPHRTVEEYAEIVLNRGHGRFINKETRDNVARILAKTCKVLKRVDSGSRLHPEYVTDYVGTYETGFGNSDYMTTWGKLYLIEIG